MTKSEFVKEIAKKSNCTQDVARTVLSSVEEEILDVISKEDSVRLGFGTVGGKTSPARKARNPRTGEEVDVPVKHGRPYIKFSRSAKETD